MAQPARRVALVFQPGEIPGASDGFADVLAKHLDGRRLSPGQRVALPGWPAFSVEQVEPPGSRIVAGTEVEITVPPRTGDGPIHLAFLVDASLTMGEGSPSAYDRAGALIDAVLLNGRSFLSSAAIVVQGGETRHVGERASPETLSGASIHRVEPRGTFDLDAGLARSLEVLEDAPDGPRCILVVTDGDLSVEDPVATAASAARQGACLFAATEQANERLAEACRHAGGRASGDAEAIFEALADIAGARASWSPPSQPERLEEDPEFETVIDTMEDRG